jgi:hypothetical protein
LAAERPAVHHGLAVRVGGHHLLADDAAREDPRPQIGVLCGLVGRQQVQARAAELAGGVRETQPAQPRGLGETFQVVVEPEDEQPFAVGRAVGLHALEHGGH